MSSGFFDLPSLEEEKKQIAKRSALIQRVETLIEDATTLFGTSNEELTSTLLLLRSWCVRQQDELLPPPPSPPVRRQSRFRVCALGRPHRRYLPVIKEVDEKEKDNNRSNEKEKGNNRSNEKEKGSKGSLVVAKTSPRDQHAHNNNKRLTL